MSIGEKIKASRKERGLTQVDLANKANISRSYLADIERNRYNPSIDVVRSIALALDTPLSFFFTEEETISGLNIELNNRDKKDISKALTETLEQLQEDQEGLMFDGEPIDEETKELLRISLENSMRLAKQIAKSKFTPKKYKK
ncbi:MULTISPECIES: helix-turn-helix transcriptional regulator [Clostridium]|uniref:Helix-turn-helix transcriptional regulator n=1 Tax=Clostridium intestinale TaxID=36845 RepID=A0A7D6VT65_9CLOT|nr:MULTISPECIES: helix-turn-helix transcriptional regulator [Clostridium]QLY79210.1 helix-turn-helix transcriptional regulator [Clostridium intestinale]